MCGCTLTEDKILTLHGRHKTIVLIIYYKKNMIIKLLYS